MSNAVRNIMFIGVVLSVMVVMTGCTNWQKKYEALDVEHQNLKRLYENCVASLDSSAAEKAQMSQQLAQSQQELAALKKRPQDTGFKGDVKVDEYDIRKNRKEIRKML